MIVEGHGMVVETGEDLKVINSGVSSKKNNFMVYDLDWPKDQDM